ncbi:transposase family protein [Streptomyces flaveolus]|uniref:transposase family protein n=1 Tax=Streptomyces flaveolus TaxID=67297 RepID=UPI0034123C48
MRCGLYSPSEAALHCQPRCASTALTDVIDHLGADGQIGIIDWTEIRVRKPAVERKDRDKFISGKNKQNAVKAMLLTAGDCRVLFRSPTKPGSCADITHARQSGLVRLLAEGPAAEILAVPATRAWVRRPTAAW